MRPSKHPNHVCPGGEPRDCLCGHSWEDHHHGCILNPNYSTEDHRQGAHRGVGAGECEAEQHESWPLNGQDSCFCDGWHTRHVRMGGKKCFYCRRYGDI